MAITDSMFGIQEPALQVQRRRMELIAANIANADTPGFQARDLDFRKLLAQSQQSAESSAAQPAAQGAAADLNIRSALNDAPPVWRVATQPAVDGNTVDMQVEQGQFADAALRYQAGLNFIDARLKSLLSAITGQ